MEFPRASIASNGPVRTLLFSTLYPSSVRPFHGLFVENRLRELLKTGEVETKVVAPVPWFPLTGEKFGLYGKYAATPNYEYRSGLEVFHPRYFLPPKIGMYIAPYSLAMGALPTIRKLIKQGFDFDLIDAHYYYPDGAAARIISKILRKSYVITARGSDLNLLSDFSIPRAHILKTAASASASICVSNALARKLCELGGDAKKIQVFRNGVDLERFYPIDRKQAREKLGLEMKPTLISVGNLVELKGHHIAIEALPSLPEAVLIIAGSGPERENLSQKASQLGVTSRVTFVGQIENHELKWWYSAADVLLLCSSREGWPNVLLEAIACGTPVIATPVGGIPEIVTSRAMGRLMAERSSRALISTYHELLANYPERNTVRSFAEKCSWQETSAKQLSLFREVSCA